ncbi:MAG TPA: trypsin-like peptidase domain-containing protein [Kineosporiaceae bacterium]|nr:trypsin-like peptidase domain-containing protein [Kineosporiaceae bacterium]
MERPATLLIDEPGETALVPQSRPSWRKSKFLWAVVPAVVLIVLIWQFTGSGPAPLTQTDVDRAVQSGIEKAQEDALNTPPDAATAYRRILPSLVTIVTTSTSTKTGSSDTAGKTSLGAGVIINAQGAVLTALHVVAGGGKIEVQFADGTRANAKVEKQQPETDIAVLGVDKLPQVTVPAVMGGGAQVGDAVFPVGNPLGLRGTLTAGVVSALDRTIRAENGRTLKDLIQFDAAVNPGNSGGPLLDRSGHVIGIVTALANPSGQSYFVGIGFAVPIATAGGAAGGPSK